MAGPRSKLSLPTIPTKSKQPPLTAVPNPAHGGQTSAATGKRSALAAGALVALAMACSPKPTTRVEAKDPPLSESGQALSSTGLAFQLESPLGALQLSLYASRPSVAAEYTTYQLGPDGHLTERHSTLDNCTLRGRVTRSGVDEGFASLTTCTDATGYPEGHALSGTLRAGGRLWQLRPSGHFHDTSGGVAHELTPVTRPEPGQPPPSAFPTVLQATPEAPTFLPFREGTALETKYLELIVVNDEARFGLFGENVENVEADSILLIEAANAIFEDSGLSPRVRLVLAAQVTFPTDPFQVIIQNDEVDHNDQLTQFLDWASTAELPSHDEAMLLSGLDFLDASAGLAPLGRACMPPNNGFSVQANEDGAGPASSFAALSTVHEVGHTLGMQHDGDPGPCDVTGGIMAAVGCSSCSNEGILFSACSQSDFAAFLASSDYETACADDVPAQAQVASCGDGIVSPGETCDCGSADCAGIDTCCDGATCQLNPGASCSDYNDTCCQACQVVEASANLVCRASRDSCDTEEVCSGQSKDCPADTFLPSGTECTDERDNTGLCYFGSCQSRTTQCERLGEQEENFPMTGPYDFCDTSCDGVVCGTTANGFEQCVNVLNVTLKEGVSCDAGQCTENGCETLIDECLSDPNKLTPGACGCGVPDIDSDQDATPDCLDECPQDPSKQQEGSCGCGVPDTDSDQDATPDCLDECPQDPEATAVGPCGCGEPALDSDEDGAFDCDDECPEDPLKIVAGACGCGVTDLDTDRDGVADCLDACPEEASASREPCPAPESLEPYNDEPQVTESSPTTSRTSSWFCAIQFPGQGAPQARSPLWLILGALLAWRRRARRPVQDTLLQR